MCHLCVLNFKKVEVPHPFLSSLSYLSWQQLQAVNIVTFLTGESVSMGDIYCATTSPVLPVLSAKLFMKPVCASAGSVGLAALCLFRRLHSSAQEGIINACMTSFLLGELLYIKKNVLCIF